MNKETECTEQPVNYSSTVIANIVEVLMGTQSTTTVIPTASFVTTTNVEMEEGWTYLKDCLLITQDYSK